MARIYFLLLILPLFCKTSYAQQKELNDIYSIGIQFRLKDHSKKKVVIVDSTNIQFQTSIKEFMHLMNRGRACPDSSWKEPLRNFKNSHISVKNILEKSTCNSFVSDKKVDEIFRSVAGWDKFYKIYPQSAGLVLLSPIYFNADHTQAVYYISLAKTKCGNGNNTMIYLRKDKLGKWVKSAL